MKYFGIISTLFVCCILGLHLENGFGANPFEALFARLQCFGTHQPNCRKGQNIDFVDRYPRFSRSFDNSTKADSYFYLFTNCNPEDPEFLHKCAGNIPRDSNFNPDCRTEIIVPGYVSGPCNMAIFRELKNEYLKNECCYNIIIVDWMWGNSFDLFSASKNLKIVGKQVAQLIINMQRTGLQLSELSCVGHSFGAHACGVAGYYLQRRTSKLFFSIVGMDPAGGPIDKNTPLPDRLDPSDADCVQVTHCNAGDCLPKYFGLNVSIGHMDFWFNGGREQPACYDEPRKAFSIGDDIYGSFVLFPPACFHFECVRFYEASINTDCQFVGVGCNSQAEFDNGNCRSCGYDDIDDGYGGNRCAVTGVNGCRCPRLNSPPPNNYYLNTSRTCPYCDNSEICLNGYSCCPMCKLTSDVKCREKLK